jgi:ferredoxin/flavodoxin
MNSSATILYFSPTGTTKEILSAVAEGMQLRNLHTINITSQKTRKAKLDGPLGDVLLVGLPVYEERIPELVIPFLKELEGEGRPAVIITVYGNIGGGIALKQLYSTMQDAGFLVVAAGQFIGQHSFSTQAVPVAEGRPDAEDLQMARDFGAKILDKLQKSPDGINSPQGKLPLMARVVPKNSARRVTEKPAADMQLCNRCGVCAKLCPTEAIDPQTLAIDETKCLRCFSCVNHCPKEARTINYKTFVVKRFLESGAKVRKQPQLFI